MNKKVIVVGAGIGGLAAALRLQSKGYEVRIFEKEEEPGGRINFMEGSGFRFDLTASILMTPDAFKEVFSWANKDYRNYLEFVKLDPNYRVHYSDGSCLDFSSDLTKLMETLESISREDAAGFLKFIGDLYGKYIISDKYFFENPFSSPMNVLNSGLLLKAFRLNPLTTIYELVSEYIDSEKLREYICFQAHYIGISPYEGPGIYNLIPTVSELYGLWYLKGGMYSYINAMAKLFAELGGIIIKGIKVEEILIAKERAVGIKTDKTEEYADIIVCNADFPYAIKNLVKDNDARGKYDDQKLKNMKYTCSNFIIYWGLSKKYPELKVHNHYIGNDFKQNIEAPFEGRLPDEPPLYIYCPSSIDPSMAPKDKDCISIVVRVPNLVFDQIKWDSSTISTLKHKVIAMLSSIKGLEDIENNIEFESYLTPEDLQKRFNAYAGTAYGLSPTLTQTNFLRPHIQSEKARNLYFVGSSVHPGAGASIVLKSSKLVAEAIMEATKRAEI